MEEDYIRGETWQNEEKSGENEPLFMLNHKRGCKKEFKRERRAGEEKKKKKDRVKVEDPFQIPPGPKLFVFP
jgi:hypothetical protein